MKFLIMTPITIILLSLLLFFTSEWLFPSWWGSHSLGHNLYMLDWDGGNKIIVYCSNPRGRTCYGGLSVIPSNSNSSQLCVITAKSNERWVIVRAKQTQDNKNCYYLINKDFNIDNLNCQNVNCDSMLQSYVVGPLDSIAFIKELMLKNVSLKLSE